MLSLDLQRPELMDVAWHVQIYIPKIPGIPSNYEYSPSDFHLEYEVLLATPLLQPMTLLLFLSPARWPPFARLTR